VGGFRELLSAPAADIDRERGVALLGAGGAAAAALVALEEDGFTDIRVYGRTRSRAAALCGRSPVARLADDTASAVRDAGLVVNATPAGLDDVSMPVSLDAIGQDAVVLDLVVGPNETPFVRAARARGLRAADGLAMLLGQGALAFERWFGIAPDREVMRRAVGR
jgi:shikimate dehydrogenase